MNIDNEEIEKFNVLASRWWDKNSEFKPLHAINPLRLHYVDENSPLKNKKVLDVGCGGGILAESMAHKGADVLGIDMGEAPLQVAKLHALESNITVSYLQTTAEQLAEQSPGQWDIVTCMEMLEHVPDPASVVEACATLVKPDGDIYFSTINRNPKSFLAAIIGAEYVLRLLPKGTHQYEKFIKPHELHHWCELSGLKPQSIIGMHYNPLFDSYKLAAGVDVNYIMHCRKLNNH